MNEQRAMIGKVAASLKQATGKWPKAVIADPAFCAVVAADVEATERFATRKTVQYLGQTIDCLWFGHHPNDAYPLIPAPDCPPGQLYAVSAIHAEPPQ